MKLDITEEELITEARTIRKTSSYQSHYANVIVALKMLGVTFKKEIDWEAETHDPSVIPDKWLVECWDNDDGFRVVGFYIVTPNGFYENYRAIKKEDWPKWAVEAHKSLED